VGFFPARRRRACPPLEGLPAEQARLTLRMTALLCHPKGEVRIQLLSLLFVILRLQPNDPLAFSNNQHSLHYMGFFTSFRMTPPLCHPEASARRIP